MPVKIEQIDVHSPMIIAACGLNCSLCRAYIRDRNPCPGCRGSAENKSKSCTTCIIKNCEQIAGGGFSFCFSCDTFPCARLLQLDRRYRTRYGVSAIANLERIRAVGAEQFTAEELVKWVCPQCGARLSMHEPQCPGCDYRYRG